MKIFPLVILLSLYQLVEAQCAFTVTISHNNPICYGFSDGSIVVNASGGNGAFTFFIENSSGTQLNIGGSSIANNLPEDWYYISVTDETPCTEIDSVYLAAPGPIDIDLSTNDLTCFGDSTGWASVDTVYNYSGAYSNVSYFWNPNGIGGNGIGSNTQSALSPGNYMLVVNDENGCSGSFDFSISSPPELEFSHLGMDPCSDSTGGCVWAAATGGVPSYTYEWTNLQNSQTTSQTVWCNLEYGCYGILVTDANGCGLVDTSCISCLSIEEQSLFLDIYPNPTVGMIYFKSNINNVKSIKVLDMSGSEIIVFDGAQNAIDLQDLTSGNYIIVVETTSLIYRNKLIKN